MNIFKVILLSFISVGALASEDLDPYEGVNYVWENGKCFMNVDGEKTLLEDIYWHLCMQAPLPPEYDLEDNEPRDD